MKITTKLISFFALLALCACASTSKIPKETGNTDTLGAAQSATNQATTNADNATSTRMQQTDAMLSSVKASVTTARAANTNNPDGSPKQVVDLELGVAQNKMRDVKDDPAELLAAAERRALVEGGRAEEARSAYDKANADARATADALALAKDAEAKAINERNAAREAERVATAALQQQLEQNKRDNQKALDALRIEMENKVMLGQIAALNKTGAASTGLAVLALGVCFWFGGPLALKKAGPIIGFFFLGGLVCFGLAQIVGQSWFKWTVLGFVILFVGATIWYVVHLYREGKLKEEINEKSKKLEAVVHDVIPVLDNAYENAEQSVRELLDSKIFNPLSSRMDAATKVTVRQLRAVAPPVV